LIDRALLRPGRFDPVIHVPAPDHSSRMEILDIYFKKMNIHVDNSVLDHLAKLTKYFTGADLKGVCREAALNHLRKDNPNLHMVITN
jgi:ATP-dependent 26S proteasome regulatory subunit